MKRQSLTLVIIGIVLFIAGGSIAFLSVSKSSKSNTSATVAAPTTSPALVVTTDVPAGTTGQQLVSKGLVSVQQIPQSKYVATDLANLQALSDQVLTTSLTKGAAIQTTDLTPSTTAIAIPTGEQAITVTVTGVSGLAGYLQPGANVDIYANINKLSSLPAGGPPIPANVPLPCTELTMTSIEVLDVSTVVPALGSTTTAGASTSSAGSSSSSTPTTAPPADRTIPASLTLLLAVNPTQSRELTFMAQNETLSVVQTQKGTTPPPIGACEGTGEYTAAP